MSPIAPTATMSVVETPAPIHDHHVQFYESDDFLCSAIGDFIADGLQLREPIVVIATADHGVKIKARLTELRLDFDAACDDGRITFLDAQEGLASFMVDGMPDEQRFNAAIGGVIDKRAVYSQEATVRAYGEMVDLLWRDGNSTAALRLEELWNELAKQYTFSLLCAYTMGNFYSEHGPNHIDEVCHRHTRVIPAEESSNAVERDSALREILMLRQRTSALGKEVEQRKRLERALRDTLAARREAEQELQDFLENAVEGLHWVGSDGSIIWANHAEAALLGYTREEYIGRNIAEFHVDQNAVAEILQRLRAGEELREYETALRCKDGSEKYVLINSNVFLRKGEFVHTRCFTRDITERKRAEEALVSAKDEAERANRVKSDFLAVMSHELRTPLNAILGYQDLLVNEVSGGVNGQQRVYLDRIKSGADQLIRLIDQLLSLSRIEAGKEVIIIEAVDVDALVAQTCALVGPIAAQKNLLLNISFPDRPVMCATDPGKLNQIILNLLANAVKFTATGTIGVLIESDAENVRVVIADTGSGIPIEQQERIFEPFVQVDASATRQHGGAGLGLPVSRNLARLLGGDIYVASIPGEGSKFTVELPLLQPAAPIPAARPVAHPQAKL